MSAYLVPCVWSIMVVIGLAFYLSNPVREKHENGILWKNYAYVVQPPDYNQGTDAQKIRFWDTGKRWRKQRTVKAMLIAPAIWLGGFLLGFLGSIVHITPAAAQEPTATYTATATLLPATTMPTHTPWPSETPTATGTGTSTPIPASQTPRVVYVNQTQVVITRVYIPVVVTVVTTPTSGPTQTPWVVTVIVTPTWTPTETPSSTPTETPTP
jgi:hypothetical protein